MMETIFVRDEARSSCRLRADPVGGHWMIQVRSGDEAIEWARRCPAGPNEVIEIRQVQEMSDFPEDVRAAAAGFEAMQAKGTAVSGG